MEKDQSREAGTKRIVRCFPLAVQGVNCYFWGDGETGRGFLIDPGERGKELLDGIRQQGWTLAGILLTHGHFDHIGGIEGILAEEEVPVRIHEAGEAYLADPALNLSAYFPPAIRLKGAKIFRDGDFLTPGGTGLKGAKTFRDGDCLTLGETGLRSAKTFRDGDCLTPGGLGTGKPHTDIETRGGGAEAGHPRERNAEPPKAGTVCALEVIHTPGHTPDSVIFYDRAAGLAFTGDTIFAQGGRGNDRFPGGNGAQLMRSIRERILTLPPETILYSGHSEPTTVGAEMRWY